MEKEIEIGKLNEIYEKYGNLGFKVDTPYGYYDIEWCGITEENADVYRCELEDGRYVEGVDYHRLKNEDDDFIFLKDIEVGESVQTIDGISKVRSIGMIEEKDTLYDIQVEEVHQYYSNGIVSHNTVFSIDALLFLFFGKTTKTDVALENFNQFRSKNEVTVGGLITIDGQDYIIERKIKRKAKKAGGFTAANSLEFYRLLADGNRENLEGEQRRETDNLITETIGTYSDFMTTIVATAGNLESLIGTKPTERGRLLTKFIGLEVIEQKEAINKKMMADYKSSMKSNIYNLKDLNDDIVEMEESIVTYKNSIVTSEEELSKKNDEIDIATKKKDKLLAQKVDIDEEVEEVNPQTLEKEIEDLVSDGLSKKKDLDEALDAIKEIGKVDFDEDEYNDFMTTIVATAGNLESLIGTKPT